MRPADIGEALRILQDREGEAKVLAGGYSLLPLLKLRLAQPGILVDIARPPGWRGSPRPTTGCASAPGPRTAGSTSTRSSSTSYPTLRDVGRRHRRPAGPQLGHDRRLGRPCRPAADWPAVLLATTRRSSCAARTASASRGPGVLPRYVHHGDRAHRGPDRVRIPRRAPGRAVASRSSSGRRATSRPSRRARRSALPRTARSPGRHRPDGRRRDAVRGHGRRGGAGRPAPVRGGVPRGRCRRRRPEPAGRRRPWTRRIQAGDGRRDGRPGAPGGHPARAVVRLRGRPVDDHPARLGDRQR